MSGLSILQHKITTSTRNQFPLSGKSSLSTMISVTDYTWKRKRKWHLRRVRPRQTTLADSTQDPIQPTRFTPSFLADSTQELIEPTWFTPSFHSTDTPSKRSISPSPHDINLSSNLTSTSSTNQNLWSHFHTEIKTEHLIIISHNLTLFFILPNHRSPHLQ